MTDFQPIVGCSNPLPTSFCSRYQPRSNALPTPFQPPSNGVPSNPLIPPRVGTPLGAGSNPFEKVAAGPSRVGAMRVTLQRRISVPATHSQLGIQADDR